MSRIRKLTLLDGTDVTGSSGDGVEFVYTSSLIVAGQEYENTLRVITRTPKTTSSFDEDGFSATNSSAG